MSKIYTGKGDGGTTSLSDGSRISKAHPRVAAYGKTDELISWLGLIRSQPELSSDKMPQDIDTSLRTIQIHLMHLASILASANPARQKGYDFKAAIVFLEKSIDRMQAHIPPLKSFILPYKPNISSQIHIARTICREAERHIVALGTDIVGAHMLTYINRLSDYLFVLARFVVVTTGCKEDFFV
ncbi:MAG: cob(I)yrinic acid a,c-diamide adenosyltransferase [Bacteroidales bacterium]|jgi:cob(I)alamin adenosyltransferase|nr:cob(I)yrinic acid a,c-diamide adenosyltransferase [Bacteroidales bacterium]MDD2264403.1 cob(I)yrinic acid a,c-diamide adenosyltransferase [Bacteroidales bacterium]MDD2831637.1 cob(I)yrinic acid a,c-diamide adenosyltransferase [Bacteroidales bacterium]MDD3209202.1 cob(I)yrinic acid a,c-diamide adenosyltransferase [Bacteroidales bacterium]MDD3697513.1 cob(I)yrinic acid a,c-diamide adenosyltransferase [Bacteroidales bacterium]